MRSALIVLALGLIALTGAGRQVQAEVTYPWCAQYSREGRNCGFWTYAQCRAALSGNGGYCNTNPMYSGPAPGQIPPPAGLLRR